VDVGGYWDVGPVGTRPEFLEDTLRCSCLWLVG